MDSAELSLRSPQNRVSRTAIWFWGVRAALGWLILLAGQITWTVLDDGYRAAHIWGTAVTVVAALVHVTVMPWWRYQVHRWETTADAVYTQSGWLHQEWRIAPISRIQTVDTARGPLEQIFGLANVTVTTASAAGPLRVHGLDRSTAQRLVEELTSTTQSTAGDAT